MNTPAIINKVAWDIGTLAQRLMGLNSRTIMTPLRGIFAFNSDPF
jgi:hypothetical protein